MFKRFSGMFKKKLVRFGAIGLVVASVAGVAYVSLNSGASVQASAVVYQPIEESFFEDGMVRAQNRSAVSADVGGKVISVLVKEGETVDEGDVLLVIETSELVTSLALLEAQRDGVLASWAQADEQISQQIASLKTQRAGYSTSEQKEALSSQIDQLYSSLDPNTYGSVAYSYRQMSQLLDERMSYAHWQLDRAWDSTPLSVGTLETQLNSAELQAASFEHEQKIYKAGYDEKIAQFEEQILNASDDVERAKIQDEMAAYKNNSLLGTYAKLISSANSQASDLRDQLSRAERQIPDSVDSVNAQIMSMKSEREALEEQWGNYQRQANAQILALQAQQASEKAIRSNISEQISLLEKSSGDESNTASFYAAQVRQIDANISEMERKIESATVRAPISGVVGAMNVVSGQMLQTGMEITEIIDPDSLMVECMLLTGDAGSVNADTPITIVWETKNSDISFPASVTRISALAVNSLSAVGLNEQRVKAVLEPSFDGETHPMDGYQVRVKFTLRSETTLTVPKSAVIKSDTGDAVFVVRDGVAHLTPIKTGLESGGLIAVDSGLTENDQVIDNPEGLDDKAKVK